MAGVTDVVRHQGGQQGVDRTEHSQHKASPKQKWPVLLPVRKVEAQASPGDGADACQSFWKHQQRQRCDQNEG